jgi:hypothetical protein
MQGVEMTTGYMHPGYAESLMEFGIPRELPQCGGWILERQIPGFPYRDAMGCYPLFCCQDWSKLHDDLEDIGDELISLALVTDPCGEYDFTYLQQCFEDVVIPFKDHFVVDLCRPMDEIANRRRRKHARRALREVQVEMCQEPTQFIEEWVALYDTLIERHNISGIRAFSRMTFARQLSIPGMVMLRAVHQDVAVGAQLYFVQGDEVHCHLGAYSKVGYELGAAYALDWFSIEYFADKAKWLDLGGGAGITDNGSDGLSRYKKGWSNETRIAYFCGRIFNREKYAEIVQAKEVAATDYFPAYRLGEFG